MNQPMPAPDWVMRQDAPMPEGVHPPSMPVGLSVGLTDPDAAGHQWMMLVWDDGTVHVEMRLPWQIAPNLLMQAAQVAAQKAAEASARQGPQIILPSGPLPDLKINRNGGRG